MTRVPPVVLQMSQQWGVVAHLWALTTVWPLQFLSINDLDADEDKRLAEYGSNVDICEFEFFPSKWQVFAVLQYLQFKSRACGLKLEREKCAQPKKSRFHASELTSYTSAPLVKDIG